MLSFRFKLVAYFSVLVLVPLLAGFLGVRDVVRQSETRRVDAELGAGLRAARATYAAALADSVAAASDLARSTRFQRALVNGNRAELATLLARRPQLTLETPRGRIGPAAPTGARRVEVVAKGKQLGVLLVALRPGKSLLARIKTGAGLGAGERLLIVHDGVALADDGTTGTLPGPVEPSANLVFAHHRYRAASTQLGHGETLLVLAGHDRIDAPVAHLEHQLLLGLLGLIALVALAAFLEGRSIVATVAELAGAAHAIARGRLDRRVPVRGRDELAQLGGAFNEMAAQLQARLDEVENERRRLREATLRFGEGLGASHDIEQLLRVIVESAVEATYARGGMVTGPDGETFTSGDIESSSERVEWPLLAGRESFGKLVLVGDRFTPDDLETAALLCGNAAVALENARLHRIVERQALVDGLTGLANRRHTEEALATEIARANRLRAQMAFVLLDIDRFKGVNDTHGHPAGDTVLRALARILEESMREIDTAGRWGGEEFALVLSGTDLAGGKRLAERIRQTIERSSVELDDGTSLRITASFGVSSLPPASGADELLAAADEALYAAKTAGRNRVVAAGSQTPVGAE